ncbi:MAG TPA: TraB/GumN family protein [Brumimicrobium sp.]|nr:TraB/GumN family protein [Brumimicrobium sp.]
MRYYVLFLLTLLNLSSFGQKKEIDRSNYQLFWEISREDMSSSAYIFGTYHSNDNDVFIFPDALYPVLENADAIVLETDITEMMLDESISHYALDSRKSNILNWVIPARGSEKVTYTAYGSDNGRPQFIDMYFKQIADNCKKTFIPLESIQDQLKIGLNNEIDPNAPTNTKVLSRAQLKQKYLEGNASDLHKYTKNSTLNYINLYKDLITDRNIKMTEGIDTIIHQNRSTFIAVGAAHLLGEKGIVPLLQEKGYTVKVVESKFEKQSNQEQKLLRECTHYDYLDERYGASIRFTGKPAVLNYESSLSRLVKYIELGQGNTYTMGVYAYTLKSNMDSIVESYFNDKEIKLIGFDSVKIDDQTMAYRGRVEFDGISQWLMVFHKNNFLYELSAYGGHRFMNSNRAISFFNSFKLVDFSTYGDDRLSERVTSTSQTMEMQFPKGVFESVVKESYDDVWSASWFNPTSNESLTALESIMTDYSIYYSDKDYGEYLLTNFHYDSITFYDKKDVEGAYKQKSFVIKDAGKEVHGKIRLIGNIIQFAQYTGTDLKRRDDFLSNFETKQPFPSIEREVKLSNNTFSTKITKAGFKRQKVHSEYKYRETNEYFLTDTKQSISYHVIVKNFKSWAFSQKPTRALLNSQISWPAEELNAIVDTVYDLSNTHPSLSFDIYYPLSENRFVGKATIVGKSIVVASAIYPNLAHEKYKSFSFLDSLTFLIPDDNPIHNINLALFKNELMVNGEEAIEQLINDNHISDSMLIAMLEWPATFWDNFDANGGLQGSILVKLKSQGLNKDVLTYWKERVNTDNFFLTLATLYVLQDEHRASDFIHVIEEAEKKGIDAIDYYQYMEINNKNVQFLKSVWPVFSPYLEDSLAWSTSFIIPELLKDEFFFAYFTSDDFIQAITSKRQPSWAAFRYLEIMYEHGVPKDLFLKIMKEWGKNKNDHKVGSIAAWKTILNEKVSFKEKRMVTKEAAVAISYSKVMAVSETPVFDLLSYEDMIGYISFDHYKDAYLDKNKTLSHIENRVITVKGQLRKFAFYKAVENGKTYFMARELFKPQSLPSYGAFGSDTYFMYKERVYNAEKVSNELIKQILEKEERD